MPPLRAIPERITSLTDQELADELQERGFNLGPILPTTRRVYERKLAELETGQSPPPSSGYDPVDDDEEEDMDADDDSPDEEVEIRQKQPRQRTTRSTRTEQAEYTRKPLHQDTPVRAAYASQSQSSGSSTQRSTSPSKSWLPPWLKLLAIVIVAVLVFLVIKNMEIEPESSIPDSKIEIEL